MRVHDGLKRWRANVPATSADPWTARGYRRARDDDDAAFGEVARAEELVAARNDARRKKKWRSADELLDELLDLNVEVDDAAKEWRSFASSYRRLAGDASADVDEADVQARLLERLRAKMRRDYAEADDIRFALEDELGVRVNDAERTWESIPNKGA